MTIDFRSAPYWEARYTANATSGAGSYGRLADYKARFVNALIQANAIQHVADFGCGDGNLLSLLQAPAYTGIDVSRTVLARCAQRFPQHRFLQTAHLADLSPADLCLSLDVIYHLTEDEVFAEHLDSLFNTSTRLVAIYASNIDSAWSSPHVRHRRFTQHAAQRFPGWRLAAHVPNPYPYDPARPDDTSFADFFVYARTGTDCTLLSAGARG
jgi:SAM-dependent methyltransferase